MSKENAQLSRQYRIVACVTEPLDEIKYIDTFLYTSDYFK